MKTHGSGSSHVVVLVCLNLIKKISKVHRPVNWSLQDSFSIWGTFRKTRNISFYQSGLCDVSLNLNKENLQLFKPKKGKCTTSVGLLPHSSQR